MKYVQLNLIDRFLVDPSGKVKSMIIHKIIVDENRFVEGVSFDNGQILFTFQTFHRKTSIKLTKEAQEAMIEMIEALREPKKFTTEFFVKARLPD